MELRSHRSSPLYDRPIAPCAQCGNTLFGPEWSEQLSDTRIRHLWVCHTCSYTFETLVHFPQQQHQRAA